MLRARLSSYSHQSTHPNCVHPADIIQMGMGKTACAVGAIQMNPPPADWRKNRAWQSLRREDMLGEQPMATNHGCSFHAFQHHAPVGLVALQPG